MARSYVGLIQISIIRLPFQTERAHLKRCNALKTSLLIWLSR